MASDASALKDASEGSEPLGVFFCGLHTEYIATQIYLPTAKGEPKMKDRISKKSIAFVVIFLVLGFCVGGAFAIVDGNYNVANTALNPVAGTIVKGAAITLGNYSSSTEVNPTPAISMSSHRAGSLQVTVTSGTTAHWSVAVQSAPSTTGTFSTPFVQHADGTITAFTNMTTTATRSFHIVGLNDNAVKFVTTLKSGAGKATLTFTPAE